MIFYERKTRNYFYKLFKIIYKIRISSYQLASDEDQRVSLCEGNR